MTNAEKQFDWKASTSQMLGRFQPWHDGHTALFKKAFDETGQVCIMIRDVSGIVGEDAGAGRTVPQTNNPFGWTQIVERIESALSLHEFKRNHHYTIIRVPNIVDISYGRDVGYIYIYTARSR